MSQERVCKAARDAYTNHHEMLNIANWDALPDYYKKSVIYDDFITIMQLQILPLTDDNLYSDQDFRSEIQSREKFYVKMGLLLINVLPGAKSSFQLRIELLDMHSRNKQTLFNFDGGRYPGFTFAHLMPFSLTQLDPTVTITPVPSIPEELFNSLKEIRALITQLAFGDPLPPQIFQNAVVRFAESRERANATRQASNSGELASPRDRFFESERKMLDYSLDPTLQPRNIRELATKLSAIFCENLGITVEKIKTVLLEFMKEKELEQFDDRWINQVLTELVDQGRYCLKSLLPDGLLLEGFEAARKTMLEKETKPAPSA